jgi:hypothetical protein
MQYKVLYTGNILVLLKREDLDQNTTSIGNIQSGSVKIGSPDSWTALFDTFGDVKNGISTIKLLTATGSEIVGTFAVHPGDPTQVLYTPFVDTLPANTLNPVAAIIDPLNVTVNNAILNPAVGTRYLILDDIGSYDNVEPSIVWRGPNGQNFVASAIINSSTSPFTAMAVGTGTTAAALGDTTLQTEVARSAYTSSSVSTNVVTLATTFAAGTATGALTEAGIFNNNSSGGTMLSRVVFSAVNKGALDTLTLNWTLTLG